MHPTIGPVSKKVLETWRERSWLAHVLVRVVQSGYMTAQRG